MIIMISGKLSLLSHSNKSYSDAIVDIISSINGFYKFEDGSSENQGMNKIHHIMSKADSFKITDNTEIIYQCTSFGKLYPRLVTEFVMTILGGKIKYSDIIMKERIRFIFPEKEQVLASHTGSTTNWLKLREDFWFDQKDFPKYLFHKFEFKDSSVKYSKNVHHSKVMIIKERGKEVNDDSAIYIGSHNMSGGAWGTFRNQGKTLFIGNYELGIFFRPKEGSEKMKKRIVESLLYNIESERYDLKTEQPFLFKKVF